MAAPTATPVVLDGRRRDRRSEPPAPLETPTARRAAAASEPPLTRRELRERARRRGPRSRTVVVASPVGRLVLALVAATVLGGGLLGLAAVRAPRAQAPAVPTAPVTEAVGTATVVGADPLAQGSAGPAALLQGLLDSRAAALTARDPATLARVEQPGSQAQAADLALVRRLVASRQVYSGLVFAAHDVTVVSRTGDRLVLRARVARAPYELVGEGGRRAPQAGVDGTPWRYTLVRLADGWRLAEVQVLG